ncbi:MAG: DUF3237 domain-containing protein [Limnohabitans sp.]
MSHQPELDFAAPELRRFADLSVTVAAPQEVGATVHGRRRLIPILGGEVQGQGWQGRVLQGGADFQLIVNDRLAELDARYTIETDAGDLIFVSNSSVRVAEPAVMAALMRGEAVDPALVYFRCSPQFETASASLAWISERLFVGTGARRPDRVLMRFFEVA